MDLSAFVRASARQAAKKVAVDRKPLSLPKPGAYVSRPGESPALGVPGRTIRIAVIDNFSPIAAEDASTPEDIGFNHGETVVEKLLAGGADPELAGQIMLQAFNVGAPDDQSPEAIDRWVGRILQALDCVLELAEQDADAVDAVNISLQNPVETENTRRVRERVEALQALGIPVVVAAGNREEDDHAAPPNLLTCETSFNVQSTTNGQLNAGSKLGNVSAEGGSTSFAAPAVTPMLGFWKSQGLNLNEIRHLLSLSLLLHGGTIPAAPGQAIYSEAETRPQIQDTRLPALAVR